MGKKPGGQAEALPISGVKLRKARLAKRLTQAQLAGAVHQDDPSLSLDDSTVSRLEKGVQKHLNAEVAKRVAAALGLPLHGLLTEVAVDGDVTAQERAARAVEQAAWAAERAARAVERYYTALLGQQHFDDLPDPVVPDGPVVPSAAVEEPGDRVTPAVVGEPGDQATPAVEENQDTVENLTSLWPDSAEARAYLRERGHDDVARDVYPAAPGPGERIRGASGGEQRAIVESVGS